jgi:antitoxin VapB
MLLAYAMNMQRSAKLFRNGRSQAVRIPREFEFPGKDVVIRKQGDKLIIEPVNKKKNSLAELLASWEPINEEWPEIEDLPPDPVDL